MTASPSRPSPTPPRLPAAALRALLPVAERDEVIADLAAEFAYRATEFGASRAHAWYWRQSRVIGPVTRSPQPGGAGGTDSNPMRTE